MTCAPYSASVRPIAGPAIIRHISRTRIPVRICGLDVEDTEAKAGNGTGGDSSCSRFSSHGGVDRRVRP